MDLVQWSPGELEDLHTAVNSTLPTYASTITDSDVNKPGNVEAAKAMFLRESVFAQAVEEDALTRDEQGRTVEADASWNPYTYIRQNWDDKKRSEFEHELRLGLFENEKTPEQVEKRAYRLATEKERIKMMQDGPTPGLLLGGLGAAIVDVTLTPSIGGKVKSIVETPGRITRALKIGGAAAGYQAATEAALQHYQDLRTAQESFLNIGAAGLLGGGIGAFTAAFSRTHPLHPENPDNPLHVANMDRQGVGFRTPDGDEEVIGFRDLSAAAAPIDGPRALPGLTSNIPGLNWMGDKITGVTPAGRALGYTGARSRELLVRMMDLGGTLTDTNRFGVKTAHSAEDIKRDLLVMRDRLFLFGEKQLQDLNRDLGQSDMASTLGLRGRVDEVAFSDVARKKLLNEWTDDDALRLSRDYGKEAAQMIEARASEYAERIHKTNAEYERELIELGALKADKALGRDYGHAQMWDAPAVMARQEEFEDFLLSVLAKQPDEEWLSRYSLSPDDLAKLQETDPKRHAELLREWAGDEYNFNLTRAELHAEATAQALKQAELDLTDTMRAYRFVKAETQKLEIQEAGKSRDLFNARLNDQRVRKAQAEAMQRAFAQAAEVSRLRTLERLAAEPVAAETFAKAEARVAEAEKRLFVTVSDSLKDRASASRLTESGEYVKRVGALAEAEAKLQALISGTPEPPPSAHLASIQARAARYNEELRKADTAVRVMEDRLAKVDEAYSRVSEKLDMHRKAKAAITDALSDAKNVRKSAAKDAGQASRAAIRAEARTPLAVVVEDISRALTNRQTLPHSIMDRIIPETGRVKARRIRLSPEQRRIAEEQGFLRTDLSSILQAQYDQLASYIGLHKAMDIRPGGRYGAWDDVMRTVDDEYGDMIRNAPPSVKPSKLIAEKESVKKDLNLLKDRLLGTENIGADKDGWAYWMSQKARQANFIRFGAGFLLSSLTDIASVHLRSGSLGKLLSDHGAEALKIMRELNDTELRAMVNATELGSQGVRMARALDADDAMNLSGIGPRGSFKHTFTSRVDQGAKWMSDKTNVISGLRAWNRFWKVTAGINRAYRLRDMTANYAKLAEREVADLASLGIDREAAERIQTMVLKHGKTDAKGHWDPNLDDWAETAEGRTAARDFRIAVERDMDRAVFTPGIGDTPGIMSSAVGKLWLQFQTYAFTFLNRFLGPASQRVATWQDAQAVAAFGHLIWSGMIVVMGKDLLNGRDPAERFKEDQWANTVKEVVDRSGLLGYLSPYVDSMLKVSGPLQEEMFGSVKIGPTSRYARNAWMESAFGANYALFRDIQSFGSALAEGDVDKITQKGLVLAPANFYLRLMNQLSDDTDN